MEHLANQDLRDLLLAVQFALFVIIVFGFLLKGAVRWVKIGILFLILIFTCNLMLSQGPGGLKILIVFGVSFVSSVAGVMSWRHPLNKTLNKTDIKTCPLHGIDKMEGWSKGFEAEGFSIFADCITDWKFAGSVRRTWIRFMLHKEKRMWAEIHVLEAPKLCARLISSDFEGGKSLITVDQMADQEMFGDEFVSVGRVPSKSAVKNMVEKHRGALGQTASAPKEINEPLDAHLKDYTDWIHRLLDSAQVVEKGDSIAVAFMKVPLVVIKSYTSWFQ